jgi:hypothetical protein
MTIRWEQRIAAALVSQHHAPIDSRLSAGVLVARTRLTRWTRRVKIVAVATVTSVLVLVAIPAVAALVYLLHAF